VAGPVAAEKVVEHAHRQAREYTFRGEPRFALLQEDGPGGDGPGPNYFPQGPNQHHRLWILDVDGTRLVIGASDFPDTSQQDRIELDEILSSIQIGTPDAPDAPQPTAETAEPGTAATRFLDPMFQVDVQRNAGLRIGARVGWVR